MTVDYVELKGNLGVSAAGAAVTLQCSSWLSDAASRGQFPPEPKKVIADAGGRWAITAIANDNPSIMPAGSYYTLTIDVPGASRRQCKIELNFADGDTQYIVALAPVAAPGAGTSYLLASNNLDDVADSAAALANLGGVSQSQAEGFMVAVQSTQLNQLEYFDQWQQTITGQTDDPLPPFGLTFGSQTYENVIYGDLVTGPAFWLGYNPHLLSAEEESSAHGALGISCFADSGDTNNGAGGHGMEFNVAFRSKDGNHATNAIEVVAVDDNANVVSLALRCGNGHNAGGYSEINFSNSDGSLGFMTMDGVAGNITVYQPATFEGEFVSIVNSTGPGILVISGETVAELAFQQSGENKWFFQMAEALMVFSSSQGPHWLLIPGASYAAARSDIYSVTQVFSSLIVSGGAVLGNDATDGFFYLPAVSGAPTGVPTFQAGSVACAYDVTGNKLYIYNSGWQTVELKGA
jgi:hypothetical protein